MVSPYTNVRSLSARRCTLHDFTCLFQSRSSDWRTLFRSPFPLKRGNAFVHYHVQEPPAEFGIVKLARPSWNRSDAPQTAKRHFEVGKLNQCTRQGPACINHAHRQGRRSRHAVRVLLQARFRAANRPVCLHGPAIPHRVGPNLYDGFRTSAITFGARPAPSG